MPFNNLQELLAAVRGFVVPGPPKRFEMAPDGLGWQPIATLVRQSFPLTGGTWVLTSPTEPAIVGDAVVLAGDMDALLGLTPVRVDVSFDLADGGNPSLLVGVAPLRQPNPLPYWNLGNAFPIWMEYRSSLTQLAFDGPTFYFSTIRRPAAGTRPAIEAGRTFTADRVELTGPLKPLSVLPGFELTALTGPITGDELAPHTTLVSGPTPAIPIAYLDLPITFSAISTDPSTTGPQQVPPPPVSTYLQLATALHIPDAPPIPVEAIFDGIGPLVLLRAETSAAASYGIEQFAKFVHNQPIGTYLDPVFKIGQTVTLTHIDVAIATDPFGLAAVGLGLGTTRSLTVVPGWVEIPEVHVDFTIDDPGGADASITAVLGGTFRFLDELEVELTAIYPTMLFAGDLATEQPIPLARIVRKFVPSLQTFPDLSLNNLSVRADFKQQRYAFSLGVVGGWRIPIGIAQFEMREASLALGYDAGQFSGEITAVAALLTQDGGEIASFFTDWRLPGAHFVLDGTFPEISLTALATALTGGGVPDATGLPEIELRNSHVRFQMEEGAARAQRLEGAIAYQFDLSTTIDAPKIGQADLAFQVRAGKAATGFVAGLVVRPDWTPDAIWSGLGPVFDLLTIKDAGLILASIKVDDFKLPNLAAASVPTTIKPGVTFFSALELKGDTFEILRQLFGTDVELDLYAHIDAAKIAESEIKARLGAPEGQGNIGFTGLEIDMKPGKGEFSIRAGARFDVWGEPLKLEGAGFLTLGPPPTAAFVIRIAEWDEPLGIKGLTINSFGLDFAVGTVVEIGVLGDFTIGSDPAKKFRFAVGATLVEFEAPGALVCKLESGTDRPLKVTDLVEQYTTLKLDEVPLLNGLAFTRFDFWAVIQPGGWTAPDMHHYEQGVGLDADLTLYDHWELVLKVEVDKGKGVRAEGSISAPVQIGGVLTISDATGKTGPRMKIDTTGLIPGAPPLLTRLDEHRLRVARLAPLGAVPATSPLNPHTVLGGTPTTYFSASGAVRLLGLYESFSGSITSDGFDVNFHAELAKLFRADFMATFAKTKGFAGHAEGNFDFELDLPAGVTIDGFELFPPGTHISGPNAFLSLDVVAQITAASVSFKLIFNWQNVHVDVAFKLDATQIPGLLADAWKHIEDWIKDHFRAFFSDLLGDVEKFLQLLEERVIWFGQDIIKLANTLYGLFDVKRLEDMAAALVQVGWIEFGDMVDALIAVFDVSFEEAVEALRTVGEACAVATNEAILNAAESPWRERSLR